MTDIYNEESLSKLLGLDEEKEVNLKEKNEKFKEILPSEDEEETYKERYGEDIDI